jgi:phosphoserine phosphatase RsbU/P
MKILIAEDDITSRTILAGLLGKRGLEVITACHGKEAWEHLHAPSAPRLVLLDWIMPEMDGLEVCRRARQQQTDPGPYIILLTARTDQGDIVEGLKAGADDYICKPYDTNELLARVEVGRRVVELQDRLVEHSKLQGALETVGAICHEFNQPLQAIFGYTELLMMEIAQEHPLYQKLRVINESVNRVGEINRKLMTISQYKTKKFLGEKNILDIDEASKKNN